MLYEVPFRGIDDAFLDGAEELRRRGFGARHGPPRAQPRVRRQPSGSRPLGPLIASGSLIAANVGPLSGKEGEARWRAARFLLERGAVDLIATDAHPPRRPYQLADVAGMTGDDHERLTSTTPAALLRDGIAR